MDFVVQPNLTRVFFSAVQKQRSSVWSVNRRGLLEAKRLINYLISAVTPHQCIATILTIA